MKKMASRRAKCGGMVPTLPSFSLTVFTVVCCLASSANGQDVSTTLDNLSPSFSPSERPSSSLLFTTTSVETLSPNSDLASTMSSPADAVSSTPLSVSSTPLSVSSTPLSESLSTTDTPTSASTDIPSSTDASFSSHHTSQSSSSVVSSGMEHLSVSPSASLQSDLTTDSSMDSSVKLSSVSLTSGSLSDSFSSLVSDSSSMSTSGDVFSTSHSSSEHTADVLQSLSSQDLVSGFSGNSIEPSMTSDLDSTMFVSGSSGILVSTHSLPESASPSHSTLVESSMTFSGSVSGFSGNSIEPSMTSDLDSTMFVSGSSGILVSTHSLPESASPSQSTLVESSMTFSGSVSGFSGNSIEPSMTSDLDSTMFVSGSSGILVSTQSLPESVSPSQSTLVESSMTFSGSVSGFSGNSIEPSMTSDLDSTMFVSGSSGILVSTQSLPESVSPSQSTLVESSMTLSGSAVTESFSGVEHSAFSDVSNSGLETSQSLVDVTSVTSDFVSTNELSSLVDVSKSVSSLTSSAIDKFSPTSMTGMRSSVSSPEHDSTSSPSEQTTIQMTTSVFQTMSSPTSSPLETSTSDLGIGSSTISSMLSPTAATNTLDISSSDVLAQSSFAQATVSEMSSTMMQEFSSVMTGVTTATAGDMHGSSSIGGESVSLSSVTVQSQSPVMSDLSSDSKFLSYTTTASVSVSFSSLISDTQSSAVVATTLSSPDSEIIKSTISSELSFSMTVSQESPRSSAEIISSAAVATTTLASSDSEIIKSTISSELPFSMTVSQELSRSSVEMISSVGYIQSSGTEVITSELFSESPVSLASYSSTLPTSQLVTSSSMVTDTFYSSQQSSDFVRATVSEDRLQTSSSQSMSMSSSDFTSSESFPVSPQTASFFSSELESSPSVPASVIGSTVSPYSTLLQTTELLGETITQTVMSSPFESEQSHSPLLSSLTSSSLESAQFVFSSSSTVASSPAVWSSTDSIAFSSEGLLTTHSMTFSPLISSEVLSSYGSVPSGHTATDSSLSAQGTIVFSTEVFPSSILRSETVDMSLSYSNTESVSGTLLSSFHPVNTESLGTGFSGSSLGSSTMITLPDSSQFISETVPGSREFSSLIVSSSLDTQGIVSSVAISSESSRVSIVSESGSFIPELSSMKFSSTVESVMMTLESTKTQTDLSGVLSSQGSGSFLFSTLVAASSSGVTAPVTSAAQSLSHSEFDRSVMSSLVYSNPTPSMISTESLLTVSGSGLFTSDYRTESSGFIDSGLTVSFNTPTTAVPSESLLSTDTSFISVYPSSSETVSSFSIGMSTFSSAVSDSLLTNASISMSNVMPSSHSTIGSSFISVESSYLTPSDFTVSHTESGHTMITSSMQISGIESSSSVLFSSLLSSAVPPISPSSMYSTQSEVTTVTVTVPSQSVTSVFSSPLATTVLTPVPTLLPSSEMLFSSDYVFSSVNQTGMFSSEGPSTALVPNGTFISSSDGHSSSTFISMHSSEVFSSNFPPFSTTIQTDLSLSVESFSGVTTLMSPSFPSSFSFTAVHSTSLAQSSSLMNTSSLSISVVTPSFAESFEGSSALTDLLTTSPFSSIGTFTSSLSLPQSSFILSTGLTSTESSLLFPSETMGVSLATDLVTSSSEIKAPFSSAMLSSTETPFLSSVETYSTSYIPVPSFSTSFFSTESFPSSTGAVESAISSSISASGQPMPSSQSDVSMTVPSLSFVSTLSGIPESSSSVLPLESVSSAGFSSLSAPGSTTDFGPTLSSSEIRTFSLSSPFGTEILSSSRVFTTQMPLSDTSLFLSSSEESLSTIVSTMLSFPAITATLLTSTEIPTTVVESSMQTPAMSDLQSSLFSETSMVTFTTMGTSSEVVVTSVPQSLYSSPSSEMFSMSEVSEPSSVIASLTTAVIPTSSMAGTSVEMSSLSIVTVGTSTVLETSMETSISVTTSMLASSQILSSEMSSSLFGSTSEIPTSILPSSELSSSLSMFTSQSEATSEILPLTSSEMMSSQLTSSAPSVVTSVIVLPSSSLEVVSSIVSSSSVDVSSEFLPLSSSLETMSSLETSSALGVSSSTVLPVSSSSLEVSSTETSTSVVMSSSVLETSSVISPTPSFSSDITSSSLSPLPTTSSTTESNTTELTSTQPTTNTTTSSVPENLLVVTVILLRSTDNIQSQAFISAMEQGLARAYSLAFQRQRDAASGSSRRKRSTTWLATFLPSWAGGGVLRRKRAAVVNDVEIQMRDVRTQAAQPSNAELTYTVKEKGQAVTAQQASQALNGLQDQELALELNRIVVTKARPASETGASTGEDDKKLWIIGAVLGPVVFLVLVWLVVCLLVRYRANHSDKLRIETADQPHLLTAKHGGHGVSREGEVAEDPEYAQATLTQTNGLVKSSPHKARYEISTDADTTATSTGREDSSTTAPKRGRRLPKKNEDGLVLLRASLTAAESTEGDQSSERVGERSTPMKKKTGKKSSFKETTEEMEMSPLDPSFYNAATLQSSRQLYAQQTFEEEDEEFLDSMEEERRKNKHRQRMKKKQGSSAAAPAPTVDTMQAAYERAQQEIDKVLGPRQSPSSNGVPGASTADGNKQRSKRRSKRGQANDGYRDDENPHAPALPPSESLDEMKSRVHALLDDAFSLLSNSYTSMGSAVSERSRSFKRNKVAPASPNKQGTSDEGVNESNPPLAKSPPSGSMPAVEEVQDHSLAPKPGEKLHTPVLVDRTYNNYDPDGLITWSPYRASDETARIVLPEAQVPSAKAPAQEKLQTTVFMETATGSGPHYPSSTHSTHPLVIRTRQPPASTPPKTETPQSSSRQDRGAADKGSSPFGTTAISDMSYTPYPGLEAYENMLAETATTTAHFTATTPSATEESGDPTLNGDVHKPEPDPPAHKPPTRDVGTRDERDFIASSIGTGTSARELVDSIRQELQSLSDKVPPEEAPKARPDKGTKSEPTTSKQKGIVNGTVKPLKKPRKSSYLDST